jgi:pyruvate kinase
VPTASGGAPRACAKYRSKLPIIALAHDRRVADQISLDWGVYCYTMDVAESVDDMIEGALIAARDEAGLPAGARVVLTAGRQTGTPGATNLIMVREIP